MQPVTKITILGLRLAVVILGFYWAVIFLGTHLPAVVSITPSVNDKVKHFSAYFGLGFLLCYVTTSTNALRRFSILALIGLVYAAMDEVTQQLVPGRVADVWDFAADAAGLFSAIAIYVSIRALFRRAPAGEANS